VNVGREDGASGPADGPAVGAGDDLPRRRSPLVQGIIRVLKGIWVVAVLGAASWYVVTRWDEIRGYAADLGVLSILAALVTMTVGRFILAAVSQRSLRTFGFDLRLGLSFYINTIAQLGKYLPGSVWHLVGRVALYRRHGVAVPQGTGVLALENLVLVGSAGLLGVALTVGPLARVLGIEVPSLGWLLAAASMLALAAWWVLLRFLAPRVLARFVDGRKLPSSQLFWLSLTMWASFGLSFWFVLPSPTRTLTALAPAAGTFALGWIAGYLSPFAPGGLGVREAVIVALLAPSVGTSVAIGAAAASRILWTLNELLLAPFAALMLARSDEHVDGVASAGESGSVTPGGPDRSPPPDVR
jgi:uncharacterized membrane protein YbhN (UPF0104 family)